MEHECTLDVQKADIEETTCNSVSDWCAPMISILVPALDKLIKACAHAKGNYEVSHANQKIHSIRYLFNNKRPVKRCTVLTVIKSCGGFTNASNQRCYVFNNTSEAFMFSCIQWNIEQEAECVGDAIQLQQPVIYCDVDFTNVGEQYYMNLTPHSYVCHNFCPEIRTLLLQGSYGDKTIPDIGYLWPIMGPDMGPVDERYYKQIKIKQYNSHGAALAALQDEFEDKKLVRFKVVGTNVREGFHSRAAFKYYCKRCNKVRDGLYNSCCSPGTRADAWLQGTVNVAILDEAANIVISDFELAISITEMKKMVQLLNKYNVNNKELMSCVPLVQRIINEKQQFRHDEEAEYFVPVLVNFFEQIRTKQNVILQIEIKGSLSRRNSRRYFSYKLVEIECEELLNEKPKAIEMHNINVELNNTSIINNIVDGNQSEVSRKRKRPESFMTDNKFNAKKMKLATNNSDNNNNAQVININQNCNQAIMEEPAKEQNFIVPHVDEVQNQI